MEGTGGDLEIYKFTSLTPLFLEKNLYVDER